MGLRGLMGKALVTRSPRESTARSLEGLAQLLVWFEWCWALIAGVEWLEWSEWSSRPTRRRFNTERRNVKGRLVCTPSRSASLSRVFREFFSGKQQRPVSFWGPSNVGPSCFYLVIPTRFQPRLQLSRGRLSCLFPRCRQGCAFW